MKQMALHEPEVVSWRLLEFFRTQDVVARSKTLEDKHHEHIGEPSTSGTEKLYLNGYNHQARENCISWNVADGNRAVTGMLRVDTN
ncbi:hypothetical protein RvY_04629 [Ramazzottius varieornatus]|uniref:Uncharacterized protein n=1 Tax=Ramazzottius varieornatus TaxID=947166 RepID=A0A1D1UVS6_RAMVA|nr:hypothetical protein RvY_04629 [Ramazzottius varieornatus]